MVASFPASGLIFRDNVDVVAVDDPKVEGCVAALRRR
jgi:hypothetical protein